MPKIMLNCRPNGRSRLGILLKRLLDEAEEVYQGLTRDGWWRWWLTLFLLMWRIQWAPNSIPICIQQDATLHSLFISGNCSTCFGWYFHPSSEAHTTVSTASGICHTVTATCRYRGKVGNWFECAVGCVRHPQHTLTGFQLFHDSGR
jgi:hypothetical protein